MEQLQSPAVVPDLRLDVNKFKPSLIWAVVFNDAESVENLLNGGAPIDTKYEGLPLLHLAALAGHVTTMRLLIRRGCGVNSVDGRGVTPLHMAAAMGQTMAVKELIRNDVTKSRWESIFGTPLHQAALYGHVDTIIAMLIAGCPLDVVDKTTGFTVLHAAAEGGHVTMVRLLHTRCNVNALDYKGFTPLHIAAANGHTDLAIELIKVGANTSAVVGTYVTPLYLAVGTGHANTVIAMLEKGCPSDVLDGFGGTLLHWAAEIGNVKILRVLVGSGCDVNAVSSNGCTPLYYAAAFGKTEAVCELIKLGAAKSMVISGTFGTPLHQAALKGHVETVIVMLEEGCPIGAVNSEGATILHWAALGGHVEMVRELVDRGCNVNVVDANGSTPLHYAAGHGRIEAVEQLITLGVASYTGSGATDSLLHVAVQNGDQNTPAILLEKRSALSASDYAGWTQYLLITNTVNCIDYYYLTPLMWAFGGGHVCVCSLLVANGADISAKDKYNWMAFEHCFVGGHASKLSLFCEACGIGSCGEGLTDALTTLITQGLVDAHKVLCLCAISGDSSFLGCDFIGVISNNCALPMIIRYAKEYINKGVSVMDALNLPDDNALSPLHIGLLALKLFESRNAPYSGSADAKGCIAHTSFIKKLLSHPVLKESVNERFPNGLSPLDLARQFELNDIAALIEEAGGRPGVWADIPQDEFLSHRGDFFIIGSSLSKVYDPSQDSHETVKKAVIKLLGEQTVDSEIHVTDDNGLVNELILGEHPDLGDVVRHVLPHIQVRHWKRVGLALGLKKGTLDDLGQKFPNDDDRYLETLSYWLEHGSNVTWKTLLDALGLFEIDELADKIASELRGAHQSQTAAVSGLFRTVTSSAPVVSGGSVAAERSPPICETTLVQVVQSHAEEFLKKMNCRVIAAPLRALDLIPESVEHDIHHSKCREDANSYLLIHLKEDADERTVREVFRIASEMSGYGKMISFATFMRTELQ